MTDNQNDQERRAPAGDSQGSADASRGERGGRSGSGGNRRRRRPSNREPRLEGQAQEGQAAGDPGEAGQPAAQGAETGQRGNREPRQAREQGGPRDGNAQGGGNRSGGRRPTPPAGHRRPQRDEEAEPRYEPNRPRQSSGNTGGDRGGRPAPGNAAVAQNGGQRQPGQQRIMGGQRPAADTTAPVDGATGNRQGGQSRSGQGQGNPTGQRSGQRGGAGGRNRQPDAASAENRRSAGPRPGPLHAPDGSQPGPRRSGSDRRGHALALETSQAAPAGKLRVVPLGGVGEVGKNMTMVEYERDIILLDCGGKFPEEEQRGIDLIVPDTSYVRNRLGNLRGILITHAHEDHIGALPYVIPQFADVAPIPIYGSPLSIGLIERKLEEHRLEKLVKLIPVVPNQRYQFGQLEAEFIHVTHSIPDTNAIAVHSPVGTIVDTADFKFDPTPVMGPPTDERRLRQLGQEGVLALFSDTVRVENEGSTPSERVVMDTMDEVIGDAKGMVLIATFASNISRIHMALRAAHCHGRKVAVAGRSMEQNAQVARDLGYLDPPEGLLMPLDEVLRLPRQQRVLVITGSQGEASAALARIASGEHPKIRISKGDVAMLSASPIPGNEETVARTINNLFRRGARVVYSTMERGVHVSGHAGRDELRRMIELLKPRYVVPIHGEYRHMILYRDLAAETGIPPERCLLPEIGGVIEFTKDSANQRSRIPAGSLLLDRLGDRGGIYRLRERDHLFDDGVVVVTMVVNRETGELIAGPELVARDLKPDLANGALREAELELRRTLQRRQRGEVQIGHLIQRTKESVGRVLYRRSTDKTWPMILPVVTEL